MGVVHGHAGKSWAAMQPSSITSSRCQMNGSSLILTPEPHCLARVKTEGQAVAKFLARELARPTRQPFYGVLLYRIDCEPLGKLIQSGIVYGKMQMNPVSGHIESEAARPRFIRQ